MKAKFLFSVLLKLNKFWNFSLPPQNHIQHILIASVKCFHFILFSHFSQLLFKIYRSSFLYCCAKSCACFHITTQFFDDSWLEKKSNKNFIFNQISFHKRFIFDSIILNCFHLMSTGFAWWCSYDFLHFSSLLILLISTCFHDMRWELSKLSKI